MIISYQKRTLISFHQGATRRVLLSGALTGKRLVIPRSGKSTRKYIFRKYVPAVTAGPASCRHILWIRSSSLNPIRRIALDPLSMSGPWDQDHPPWGSAWLRLPPLRFSGPARSSPARLRQKTAICRSPHPRPAPAWFETPPHQGVPPYLAHPPHKNNRRRCPPFFITGSGGLPNNATCGSYGKGVLM